MFKFMCLADILIERLPSF